MLQSKWRLYVENYPVHTIMCKLSCSLCILLKKKKRKRNNQTYEGPTDYTSFQQQWGQTQAKGATGCSPCWIWWEDWKLCSVSASKLVMIQELPKWHMILMEGCLVIRWTLKHTEVDSVNIILGSASGCATTDLMWDNSWDLNPESSLLELWRRYSYCSQLVLGS